MVDLSIKNGDFPWCSIETVDFPMKNGGSLHSKLSHYQWVTQLTQQTEARCAPQGRWFCREDWEVTSWLGILWPDPKIAYFREHVWFPWHSANLTWIKSLILINYHRVLWCIVDIQNWGRHRIQSLYLGAAVTQLDIGMMTLESAGRRECFTGNQNSFEHIRNLYLRVNKPVLPLPDRVTPIT